MSNPLDPGRGKVFLDRDAVLAREARDRTGPAHTGNRRKGVARRLDELQATARKDPDAFDDRAREIIEGLAAMFAVHDRNGRGQR